MKEWWSTLNIREKQFLTLGAGFIFIFLLYSCILSPLYSACDSLRNQLSQDQTLLAWMQANDQHLQTLEPNSEQHNASTASLLGIVQKQINNSPLANQVSQLQQQESNAVHLVFAKVNFDLLITWIAHSWHEQGLKVNQITVTPTDTPGIVFADMIIGPSSP